MYTEGKLASKFSGRTQSSREHANRLSCIVMTNTIQKGPSWYKENMMLWTQHEHSFTLGTDVDWPWISGFDMQHPCDWFGDGHQGPAHHLSQGPAHRLSQCPSHLSFPARHCICGSGDQPKCKRKQECKLRRMNKYWRWGQSVIVSFAFCNMHPILYISCRLQYVTYNCTPNNMRVWQGNWGTIVHDAQVHAEHCDQYSKGVGKSDQHVTINRCQLLPSPLMGDPYSLVDEMLIHVYVWELEDIVRALVNKLVKWELTNLWLLGRLFYPQGVCRCHKWGLTAHKQCLTISAEVLLHAQRMLIRLTLRRQNTGGRCWTS